MNIPKPKIEHEISTKSILKVLMAAAIVLALSKLVPVLFMLFFAILIAATLQPVIEKLTHKGWPEWLARSLIIAGFLIFVGGVTVVLIPAVVNQMAALFERLPELRTDLERAIKVESLRDEIHRALDHPQAMIGDVGKKVAEMSGGLVEGLYQFMVLLILSIYLLFDGEKAYLWFLAYFSGPRQRKIHQTAHEMRPVVFAYVGGQAITCALIGIFIFATHQALKVPGALALGVLAMLCDIVPVLGFIISLSASIILALTVSAQTALIVAALHVGYMLFENNFLVPKIYGRQMKISGLAVFVSIIAANFVAGIPGMVLILPIVASYPIIEKIWLKPYVGLEAIAAHHELLEDDDKTESKVPTRPA